VSAAELAAEAARDQALIDVGNVILGLQENGTPDGEIVSTVLDMFDLRISLACIDAVEALTWRPM
jgi:hypothetical protein